VQAGVGSDEEDHFHKAWLCYLHTTTVLLLLAGAVHCLLEEKRRHKERVAVHISPPMFLVFRLE
jgi:hypothetical protein